MLVVLSPLAYNFFFRAAGTLTPFREGKEPLVLARTANSSPTKVNKTNACLLLTIWLSSADCLPLFWLMSALAAPSLLSLDSLVFDLDALAAPPLSNLESFNASGFPIPPL